MGTRAEAGSKDQMEEWARLSAEFSLIPLDGKRPIETNWQQWCEEKRSFNADDFRNHNAGVACGPASNALVVDVDDANAFKKLCADNSWDLPKTMTVQTGSGLFHLYFSYPHNGHKYGCASYTAADKTRVFDVRGIGGQVVAPGSIHPDTQKPYKIVRDCPRAEPPAWLLEMARDNRSNGHKRAGMPTGGWSGNINDLPLREEVKDMIVNGRNQGERSEALMSVCNGLVYSRLTDSEIYGIFDRYAIGEKYRGKGRSREKWLQKHIDKARSFITEFAEPPFKATAGTAGTAESTGTTDADGYRSHQTGTGRVQGRVQTGTAGTERNISAEVREWVLEADGKFSVSDIDKDLGIRTRQEKINRSKSIDRLMRDGKIERVGLVRGHYQTIDSHCPLINFINVESTRSEIQLFFNLHNLYFLQPKNIIILAGDSNAGKTAGMITALYNTVCYLNKTHVNKHVNYYSSEMGPAEWNQRLSKTNVPLSWWAENCNIFQRSENFHQIIDPDAFSFIDYLEIHRDFYEVGGMIKAIFDRLNTGVAVIALQKNRGQSLGLGGNRTLEKARLYLTVQESQPHGHTMRIEKGKNPIGQSHNGCSIDFRIVDGWKLQAETVWERREERTNA